MARRSARAFRLLAVWPQGIGAAEILRPYRTFEASASPHDHWSIGARRRANQPMVHVPFYSEPGLCYRSVGYRIFCPSHFADRTPLLLLRLLRGIPTDEPLGEISRCRPSPGTTPRCGRLASVAG